MNNWNYKKHGHPYPQNKENKMNERGMIVTGVIGVISLLLVMIMAVNLRVTEMTNEIGFLRECVIELNIAMADHEYENWMGTPTVDLVDPFRDAS